MRTPQHYLLVLALMAGVAVPWAGWANEAELFPSTEVTARYDVAPMWGWVKKQFAKADAPALPQAQELAGLEQELAAIEPAAGHGGGDSGGHAATGKSEGQKSFSGKTIGAEAPLPKVTIGGKEVVSRKAQDANELEMTLPESMKKGEFDDFLNRRYFVTPYAHDPRRGEAAAPITVIQFIDLSCGQCMPEIAKMDAVLAAHASNTNVTHIHAPTARFQDTNMPAFYGKIAARAGVFWEYREMFVKDNPTEPGAMFDELVKSGVAVRDARSMMLTDARRFYRELDADALLARSFGVSKPPVVFVNGIRVGDGGIPLEKLEDVMQFVSARIQHGLTEPPK